MPVSPLLSCRGTGQPDSLNARAIPELDPAASRAQVAELCSRAALLIEQGDSSSAEPLLLEALRIDPRAPKALNNLGVLRLGQGRLAAAAELFDAAQEAAPQNPEPHLNLALTLELAGDYPRALVVAEKGLVLCATDAALAAHVARLRALQAGIPPLPKEGL